MWSGMKQEQKPKTDRTQVVKVADQNMKTVSITGNTYLEITKVEDINDASVRLTFADGTTLRMSRKAYGSGSWKSGTTPSLVKAVQG